MPHGAAAEKTEHEHDRHERHGLRLFRINSDFIPFGSHPVNHLAWWEEFAAQLREVGRRARDMDHRLSFHVTQYTILNSANPEVVFLRASSLDDPEAFEPGMIVFASRAPSWAQLDPKLPTFPEMAPPPARPVKLD